MKENKEVSIETMSGVGKNKKIAGREYLILPVNIRDMHYIIGESEEDKLIILDKKKLEEDSVDWQLFGLNVIDEKRRKIFIDIVSRYVFYCVNGNNIPMTEKLIIEHNWSFKEIGTFLYTWCQISD